MPSSPLQRCLKLRHDGELPPVRCGAPVRVAPTNPPLFVTRPWPFWSGPSLAVGHPSPACRRALPLVIASLRVRAMNDRAALEARIRRDFPRLWPWPPPIRVETVSQRVMDQLRVIPGDQTHVLIAYVSPRPGLRQRQFASPFITTSFVLKHVLSHYRSKISLVDNDNECTFLVRLP
ncbi:unnamed protein product [Urochloa humidicola]